MFICAFSLKARGPYIEAFGSIDISNGQTVYTESTRMTTPCTALRLGKTLAAALMLVFAGANCDLNAAVITAASPSRADVGTAVDTASEGDTVMIPPGTANWTTSLRITKGITLQGAGVGKTMIQDSISTIPFPILDITLVANRTTRVTGIEFRAGSRGVFQYRGAIEIIGINTDNRRFRVDHCKFEQLIAHCIVTYGALGVIDHNVANTVGISAFCVPHHPNWNGGVAGDGSWTAPDQWGTDQFVFIEDNDVTYLGANSGPVTDSYEGARFVVRRNRFVNCTIHTHGTESTGRGRGTRAIEVYSNDFTGKETVSSFVFLRSGTALVWGNSTTGFQGHSDIVLVNYRDRDAHIPFSHGNAEPGGADGKNPWDANQSGGPFQTGTAGGNDEPSNYYQTRTVTVIGASWATDRWRGYTIVRSSGKPVASVSRNGSTAIVSCAAHGYNTGDFVSVFGANQNGYNMTARITVMDGNTFSFPLGENNTPASPGTGTIKTFLGNSFSTVVSNTSNTITYIGSVFGSSVRFSASDTFELWRVMHAFDQPGRAGGSLLSGWIPVINRPSANDQVTSPCYEWNNTRDGGIDCGFAAQSSPTIRENEHFFNNTPKPGYTPFAYPHPLITPPRAPTLQAVAAQ